MKPTTTISILANILISKEQILKHYTGRKKLKGNPKIYLWVNELIIYTLASMKVNVTNRKITKMKDMLIQDYIPNEHWELPDLLEFVSKNILYENE